MRKIKLNCSKFNLKLHRNNLLTFILHFKFHFTLSILFRYLMLKADNAFLSSRLLFKEYIILKELKKHIPNVQIRFHRLNCRKNNVCVRVCARVDLRNRLAPDRCVWNSYQLFIWSATLRDHICYWLNRMIIIIMRCQIMLYKMDEFGLAMNKYKWNFLLERSRSAAAILWLSVMMMIYIYLFSHNSYVII